MARDTEVMGDSIMCGYSIAYASHHEQEII